MEQYAVYAYGRDDKITDEHSIYEDLSREERKRRKKYREFVKAMVKDKGAMKGEMDKRTAYGSEGFLKKVVQEYNIDIVIKPQGRPKKGKARINRAVPFLPFLLQHVKNMRFFGWCPRMTF